MVDIYTDASFKWKKQLIETNKKRGKVAIKFQGEEPEFKKVEQELIDGLKQYTNLFELRGIRLAMMEALKRDIKEVTIYTDSKTARGWADKGRSKKKKRKVPLSEAHRTEIKIVHLLKELFNNIKFKWIKRDNNKAGVALEELDEEK